ncbi:MAG TPA: sialidase family protein [Candidatus Thermoplasmatota archaeon]|nr:sialidase family protein [Candidatus Thermoplasmatota archaeon]
MRRLTVITVGLLVLTAALVPMTAALFHAQGTTTHVTYFLHTPTLLGPVDELGEFAGEGSGPWMDERAPSTTVPAIARGFAVGNPDQAKNLLNAYWSGEAEGRVSNATARLWMTADTGAIARASLFADGATGAGGAFATASVLVPRGAPTLVTFDFGAAAADVEGTLVLSVASDTDQSGVNVLFDAQSFASSFTFDLGDAAVPHSPTWTPAPGWRNVTLINTTATFRETTLALSPTDPDLLVACTPSGVPNTDKGQSYFHASRDGGASWSFLDVETAMTDPRTLAFEGGDCDVAFGPEGTIYVADTWLGSLSVGHSSDAGASWTGTALAASAPVVDRPWLSPGPGGRLDVTWQDVQSTMPSAIWHSRSRDAGLTFSAPRSVAVAGMNGGFTWTGNLVVSADGRDLYSVYTRRMLPQTGTLDDSGPETVWVSASHDEGASWQQHLVATMPSPASFLYPSIALDAGGMLHVVFSSKTASDRPIWYARSTDKGDSWSTPVKVLAGVTAYSPWVVGGAAGEAAIAWFGIPTPVASASTVQDWYFYAARVADGAVLSAGTTTTTPIFHGIQAIPEFEQVRLDADGKMHIGASAFYTDPDGATDWALFYQREG